ncbi:hypothetical protein [Kibdelosporangium phytohabitans]|uniref:Uncharacterized protein n=1 Tax=Kibdelosporangium phytohabitans TaxID=860235 RepID=A0A0N9HW28_9PSEU|nr:hypothetical protein [Kibdelosporangium phytohabitans]ALG06306.1 hypothetical protein AOZ06_04645 [Kibdelosporangium phytohabitans]MBE1467426.1 hypothetical protein [Kibdelosporangium phytohabitans]
MTTASFADHPRTALHLIAEAIARLRSTDPTDTASSLLAAWHGFGTAEAAGGFLSRDSVDDAVLARNARAVIATVSARLRDAPSLPYIDKVSETVHGLVPDNVQIPVDDRAAAHHDPDQPADRSAAGLVRRAILALVSELNTLLSLAAEHAANHTDRAACEHGTRLAYELGSCWEGRLGSFLTSSRDLGVVGMPRRQSSKTPSPKERREPNR